MEMAKRTYSLPLDILYRFESQIAPGKRSAKVVELIDAWAEEQERQEIRNGIIAGCKDMNQINLKIVKEWEATDDALWATIEF